MPVFLNLIGHLSLFDTDDSDFLALCNILAAQSTVVIISQLFHNFYYKNIVTGTSMVGMPKPTEKVDTEGSICACASEPRRHC